MSSTDMSSRLAVVERALQDGGYRDPTGTVVSDYKYVAANGAIDRVDLLACADPHHCDISTSCIDVLAWLDDEPGNGENHKNGHKAAALRNLSSLAAPVAFLALPDRVEVWSVVPVGSSTSPELKETLPYDRLSAYFHTPRGRELAPHRLLTAKQGTRQLSFFDVNPSLIEFARNATQRTLVDQFEEAISLASSGTQDNALTRIAIRVLAACILQDKLPDGPHFDTKDVFLLLKAVRKAFPRYFLGLSQDMHRVGRKTVAQLYDALRAGFTFRSLTNDMLAYFYENTLVRPDMRKELGIYYTPRNLARRILARLPVEDLHPENRTVLDGTCGSGNLLLAAYERLEALLPVRWTSADRHNYLLEHIWGIDKDSFACEVARLSLLIKSLPAGDSWRIETGNVFQVSPQDTFGGVPGIIVGNPPFAEQHAVKGKAVQKAAQVLEQYVDWLAPSGLLGVVLPVTFLENPSSKDTRKTLLERCDVLEVWHLPEGEIPNSAAATAIILARKLAQPRTHAHHLLTRVEVKPRSSNQPMNEQPSEITYVVPQQAWFTPDWVMLGSELDSVWKRIERVFAPIHGTFCTLHNGVQPGQKARAIHFSDHKRGSGWRPVLYDNVGGQTLQPFAIQWARQKEKYIKYPSRELHRQRKPEHFQRPVKVIVNGQRNAGSPWRLYAAIDRDQLVVTENFHYALPGSASPEELAAVLNSMVANAWYASRSNQWNVRQETLKRLPFPTFDDQPRRQLTDIVRQIESLEQSSPMTRRSEIRELVSQLDDIVFHAYGLTSEECILVRSKMEQFTRPGDKVESKPVTSSQALGQGQLPQFWRLTGRVESVDAESKTARLWVEGNADETEIPIPEAMPGWALRPGAAFQVDVPRLQRHKTNLSQMSLIRFRPLDLGYLSYDELL